MDLENVRIFFMWCSIINGALLIFTFLIFAAAGNFVYKMHSKLFPMSRDSFNLAIYSLVGIYKIFFIVFNLVPYLAISILSG